MIRDVLEDVFKSHAFPMLSHALQDKVREALTAVDPGAMTDKQFNTFLDRVGPAALPAAPAGLWQADALVSTLHDFRELLPEERRAPFDQVAWKIHDILRPGIEAAYAEGKPEQESIDNGDFQ